MITTHHRAHLVHMFDHICTCWSHEGAPRTARGKGLLATQQEGKLCRERLIGLMRQGWCLDNLLPTGCARHGAHTPAGVTPAQEGMSQLWPSSVH